MTQLLLPNLAGALILLIGGVVLLWWLLGLIRSKGIRRLLRFVLVPLYVIGLVGVGLSLARAQMGSLPSGAAPGGAAAVVSESMTVSLGTLTQTLKSTGALAPADNTVLSFSASAPVTEVDVQAGDQVHAGDVLARIDMTTLDARVRNAQITLTQAQNSLDELTAAPRDIDVKIAQANVQAATAGLSSASQTGSSATDVQIAQYREQIAQNQLWQAQLNRDISSARSNPNAPNAYASQIQSDSSLAQSETSVQIAQANYDSTAGNGPNQGSLGSANAQLVSAQASLDSLLAGPSDSDLKKAQIAVQTAQLTLDSAKQALDDAVITAPFDGIVAAVNIEVGEMPPATGAITLIDTSSYTTTLSVDEQDIAQLQVGQPVNLNVQAFPDTPFTATVTRIEPAPKTSSGLVTYSVEVTFNRVDDQLRPGMTTVANVILSHQDNVMVVPNRFITTDDTTGKSTVKVQTAPATYSDVPITIGAATDSDSVIAAGISVGQTLVILQTASTNGPGGLFSAPPGGGGAAASAARVPLAAADLAAGDRYECSDNQRGDRHSGDHQDLSLRRTRSARAERDRSQD